MASVSFNSTTIWQNGTGQTGVGRIMESVQTKEHLREFSRIERANGLLVKKLGKGGASYSLVLEYNFANRAAIASHFSMLDGLDYGTLVVDGASRTNCHLIRAVVAVPPTEIMLAGGSIVYRTVIAYDFIQAT
ncbi:MAG TPA: hypothetical protein PKO36_18575 [Candidatus Hydrogenedentes bacterium]|nr:hypothetical protein [Candidatus Hydrogenedentota bacterium]